MALGGQSDKNGREFPEFNFLNLVFVLAVILTLIYSALRTVVINDNNTCYAHLFDSRYELLPEMAQLESAPVNNISTPKS